MSEAPTKARRPAKAEAAPSVKWPADAVERRAVADLVPYARNARTHSDAQVAQIAASIREWGWTTPVLIDEDGGIIAGHGRVLAARLLMITDVPVMVARGWTDAQRRAYVLADNRLALSAGWDEQMLSVELGDLRLGGFELGLIGFDGNELDALLGGASAGGGASGAGNLAEAFGVPPFSVLNAREGWWQDRKRAWLALGIESELGRGDDGRASSNPHNDDAGTLVIDQYRGKKTANSSLSANATPGGSKMPAADYGKSHARGDGRGRADAQG
jgi:ParB-like nuclease family protein